MSDQARDGESKKPQTGKARKPGRGRRARKRKAAIAAEPGAVIGAAVRKTPWHEHKVAIIAITTLFTVLGGVSLALFNNWRAPQTLSAKIGKLTVETNVVLSNYLKSTDSSPSDYTEALLEQVGYVVHVQVQLDGFKGRKCEMRWEVYDSATRERIFFADWDDEQTAIYLVAEAASDISSPKFWVPPSPDNKPFFVHVMIFDDKNERLTYDNTEIITPHPVAQPNAARTLSPTPTVDRPPQ